MKPKNCQRKITVTAITLAIQCCFMSEKFSYRNPLLSSFELFGNLIKETQRSSSKCTEDLSFQ